MRNNMLRIGVFILLFHFHAAAQIYSGKITYERKTDLYKKFKDSDTRRWIKEANKTKIEYFELSFNDSLSYFRPQESDLKEDYSWATQKNIVYQNLSSHQRITIKSIWGEKVYLSDTLYTRRWQVTERKRTICGYSCRKVIWKVNDSTRIYAWYTDVINAPVGPESFYGLPGAILGVATEDGSVVYFATKIEIKKNDPTTLVLNKKVKKYYTPSELKSQLEKDYGQQPWGQAMLKGVFENW